MSAIRRRADTVRVIAGEADMRVQPPGENDRQCS
jgi:hypothetical protein